jgi:hypothetical protein
MTACTIRFKRGYKQLAFIHGLVGLLEKLVDAPQVVHGSFRVKRSAPFSHGKIGLRIALSEMESYSFLLVEQK